MIDCKFKGFDTLNNLYIIYLNWVLINVKNVFDFVARLKDIHINIFNMWSHFKLKTNFLIFLFHIDLNKIYDVYFTHYIQDHILIINVNIEAIFSLKYVIRRFINIVINYFFKREKFNYVFIFNVFLIALLLFS